MAKNFKKLVKKSGNSQMGGEGGPTFGNFPHIISFLVSEGLPKAALIIPTWFQFSSSSSSLPEAELPDRLVEKPIQRLE